MPWCDECARFWTPPSMKPDGTCPSCGRTLTAELVTARNLDLKKLAGDDARVPWHFKVLLVGTIGYLIYRLIWFIGWLRHHS